ncbi:MAG TPA: hypothetical protein VLA93_18210 [Pyrinomonadaceae bacterium]|nr:hypothetical protein [Pyrinomonadaceae bacterium]
METPEDKTNCITVEVMQQSPTSVMTIKRRPLLLILAVASVTTGCGNSARRSKTTKERQALNAKRSQASPTALPINPSRYNDVRSRIDAARTELSLRYQRIATTDQKPKLINDARELLTHSVYNDIFPYW